MAWTPSSKPGIGTGSRITPCWRTSSSRQDWASSGRTPEDLGGPGHQLRLGQVAVAELAGLGQGELEAGLDPLAAVVGDADALGDLVGRS
jgi:hypothetical protein